MAELKDILEVHDFTVNIQTAVSLPNNLSEAEIDLVLSETGNQNPKINDVSFFLSSPGKVFAVSWLQDNNQYVYLKMKIAS